MARKRLIVTRRKNIRKLRKKVRKELFSLTSFPLNIDDPLDLTGRAGR